jgi:VRR-NUC domain-containing protein
MAAVRTLPPVNERQFLKDVRALATQLGWAEYHTHRSDFSPAGWPDLALCRPPRLVLAELKSEKGKVSDRQQFWLDLLGRCPGIETYLWRPSHLDEIVRILR